jgi:hypothetical protein
MGSIAISRDPGIESELSTAKVPPEGVRPLVAALRVALDELNGIRREVWLAALVSGRPEGSGPWRRRLPAIIFNYQSQTRQ